MTATRIPLLVSAFGFLFMIQEGFLNRINFYLGGFSLFLAIFITWVVREERTAAITVGFIAGIFADLSPTVEAPFGLWTFILVGIGYLFSANLRSTFDVDLSPISSALLTAFGVTFALACFAITSSVLGGETGSLVTVLQALFGNAMWTVLLSPIYMPLALRVHEATLTSRYK